MAGGTLKKRKGADERRERNYGRKEVMERKNKSGGRGAMEERRKLMKGEEKKIK